MERFYSLSEYFLKEFGRKLSKEALSAQMTCPNRDGTIGTGGCIFCSAGGSGDFSLPYDSDSKPEAAPRSLIAYLQAFTNTYAAPSYLRRVYRTLLSDERYAGLSIGTRPDCLSDEVLAVLKECLHDYPDKFIWVELGFQTANEKTASFIRRGYNNEVFENAVVSLHNIGVPVICHLILGLPTPSGSCNLHGFCNRLVSGDFGDLSVATGSGDLPVDFQGYSPALSLETREDYLNTLSYVNHLPIFGIKLQLLHVLKGTDLATCYECGLFRTLSEQEYVQDIVFVLGHLKPDIVVHRLTGDGPKSQLIAPDWSQNKHHVLNAIRHEMKLGNITQGCLLL